MGNRGAREHSQTLTGAFNIGKHSQKGHHTISIKDHNHRGHQRTQSNIELMNQKQMEMLLLNRNA